MTANGFPHWPEPRSQTENGTPQNTEFGGERGRSPLPPNLLPVLIKFRNNFRINNMSFFFRLPKHLFCGGSVLIYRFLKPMNGLSQNRLPCRDVLSVDFAVFPKNNKKTGPAFCGKDRSRSARRQNEMFREGLSEWMDDYRNHRLHSALGYRCPAEVYFAGTRSSESQEKNR